ncbi:MAG TPA: hypothetical protein VGH86_16085 [Phenylobacterium sp.]
MTLHAAALRAAVLAATCVALSGCLAIGVAGAAVDVAGTAVGVTAKAVGATARGAGAVVGAAIPDGKSKKDDKSGS